MSGLEFFRREIGAQGMFANHVITKCSNLSKSTQLALEVTPPVELIDNTRAFIDVYLQSFFSF
jgi:hypothetical protein